MMFNVTGGRNGEKMLELINQNAQFTEALFTPSYSSTAIPITGNT